tara:strand:+ start:4292 stop:4525 length:234 start_codon:yes stop_codon:yes gene_type:complete
MLHLHAHVSGGHDTGRSASDNSTAFIEYTFRPSVIFITLSASCPVSDLEDDFFVSRSLYPTVDFTPASLARKRAGNH